MRAGRREANSVVGPAEDWEGPVRPDSLTNSTSRQRGRLGRMVVFASGAVVTLLIVSPATGGDIPAPPGPVVHTVPYDGDVINIRPFGESTNSPQDAAEKHIPYSGGAINENTTNPRSTLPMFSGDALPHTI